MGLDNLAELIIIGLALTYSRFARLPLMVSGNILLYSVISLWISNNYELDISPGYELHYGIGGAYFILMGFLFLIPRDKLYMVISATLFCQGIMSGVMLVDDSFSYWHEVINDKALIIECIIVWLSTSGGLRPKGCE